MGFVFVILLASGLSFLLVLVLKIVSVLVSESVILSREELSSYECGFEHYSLSRIPFSLRYFFLTMIFLIFDLEIVLLLYVSMIFYSIYNVLILFLIIFFVLILFAGLIYEWSDGSLEWVM